MSPPDSPVLIATEWALILGGSVLLWMLGLSASARRTPAALTTWDATVGDFFLFLWLVICGGVISAYATGLWFKHHPPAGDASLIWSTAAFQLGMLAGVFLFKLGFNRRTVPPASPPAGLNPLLTGAATFLIAMPVVTVVSLLWEGLLKLCHISAPKQEAIEILRHAKSPVLLTVLLVSAILIAPIAEELIFRAGIFRYVRTRLPRWAALLVPALLFATLHQNLASFAPLAALGLLLSLAYERTGRIGTSIVAHACFNLTSALLVFAGMDA